MKQRDIDALREGIRQQERSALIREDTQRIVESVFARVYVYDVDIFQAQDIRVGDRLCATDDGCGFYVSGTVTGVDPAPNGDERSVFVRADLQAGGRTGTTLKRNALVLLDRP